MSMNTMMIDNMKTSSSEDIKNQISVASMQHFDSTKLSMRNRKNSSESILDPIPENPTNLHTAKNAFNKQIHIVSDSDSSGRKSRRDKEMGLGLASK